MIKLTRIGQQDTFLLNPDLIERVDSHVDSVLRLTNGIEYVVVETADEIVDRIVALRARVFYEGPTITRIAPDDSADEAIKTATVVELLTNRSTNSEVPQ